MKPLPHSMRITRHARRGAIVFGFCSFALIGCETYGGGSGGSSLPDLVDRTAGSGPRRAPAAIDPWNSSPHVYYGATYRRFLAIAEDMDQESPRVAEFRDRARALVRRQSPGDVSDPYAARPTYAEALWLSQAMQDTGAKVDVTFRTSSGPGARIRYRVMGDDGEASASTEFTDNAIETLTISNYYIWSERGGRATSPTDQWFTIEKAIKMPIVLEETTP